MAVEEKKEVRMESQGVREAEEELVEAEGVAEHQVVSQKATQQEAMLCAPRRAEERMSL